jgi:hypothetical protein
VSNWLTIFPVMDDSPFRRIVLPALLVASAGFAALTGPMASGHGARWSQHLPHPFNSWVDSALITHQHKEFSIRYIGFAILSSVTIGVGTAGVMRRRQSRVQRHQRLLNQVLTAAGENLPSAPEIDVPVDSALASGISSGAASGATAADGPSLDWSTLLEETVATATDQAPTLSAAVLSTPLESHEIYQVQSCGHYRSLAIKVGDGYYSFYRQRPNLAKTQSLVQQLQRRGQRAIATRDGSGYVVWVHQPDPVDLAITWTGWAKG